MPEPDAPQAEPLGPEDIRFAALHPAMSREDTFRTLYKAVEYVIGAGVPGRLAEFGTMTGETAQVLAKALGVFGERFAEAETAHGMAERELHLFDSFEGLPPTANAIDAAAPHVAAGLWSAGACRGIDALTLARRCARYLAPERIRVHAGWFSATLPNLPDATKFALVHIDSDLYESARDVLDHLCGRDMLAEGAMLLFDDWDCNRASPELGERRAFAEAIERHRLKVSDCGPYGAMAHRFIVHGRAPLARAAPPRRGLRRLFGG
jgi:hypothetical protein